jgi:hypothetical protein
MSTPIDNVNPRASATSSVRASAHSAGFSDAMQAARQSLVGGRVRIQPGDTLMGLVRQRVGDGMSEQRLTAWVNQVAQANGLRNPNLILAGQTLDLSMVNPASAAAVKPAQPRLSAHPVLSKTLDRAVDKGYIPAQERPAVERRIVGMGKQYGFSPDDFARMALMESDGLNPKATNGRCHGIIQFCEGHARGADSVGLRGRAHEIAQMSVSQQLNLVERYFNDVGLTTVSSQSTNPRAPHRLGLDDLYLSVLTPSARQESRPHAPLNIAGDQARALYVDADRDQGITRQSLTRGLQQHAHRVLSQHEAQQQAGNAAATQRQQVAARNSYVQVAVLDTAAAKLGPPRP